MLPPDVSAIQTVTPSDVFNWPGLNVPLTWESERTGIENNWYALTGCVVAVKVEADGDLPIAIQDATGDNQEEPFAKDRLDRSGVRFLRERPVLCCDSVLLSTAAASEACFSGMLFQEPSFFARKIQVRGSGMREALLAACRMSGVSSSNAVSFSF